MNENLEDCEIKLMLEIFRKVVSRKRLEAWLKEQEERREMELESLREFPY